MSEKVNPESMTDSELIAALRDRAAPLAMRQAEYVEHALAIPADHEGLEAAEIMIAAADRLEAASEMLEDGKEFLEAAEAVFDWMNGNDLSADHAEQRPGDFERISVALVKFRAAIARATGE